MEKDYIDEYINQSEVQVELIRCRYNFGLSQVEIILNSNEEKINYNWVDIGSNLGMGLTEIREDVNIISTDLDHRYLERQDNNFQKLNFDAQYLPFSDDSCDVISCFETIEHIELSKVYQLFQEFQRVLKPDGILLLSTPNKETNGRKKMSEDHKQEFSHIELMLLLDRFNFDVQNEYGQNFVKDNNLLHQLFLDLRQNIVVRHIYNTFPPFVVKTIRNKSLNCFGKGEIRKKQSGETERIMYFVCRKKKLF